MQVLKLDYKEGWAFEELMLSNYGVGEDSWVPWTARRSNQSILKDINLEYSLEGLMLDLKLQYFGHLMRRAYSLEKTLMLAKIEGKRKRGGRAHGIAESWTWLSNWTAITTITWENTDSLGELVLKDIRIRLYSVISNSLGPHGL